ncbi:MAG: DEDD exonuclease domain-containing protein [Actinobacteria bacterium]|nr:DEDD exonuclease domain-containing protein [Actinomycetota bacterium]
MTYGFNMQVRRTHESSSTRAQPWQGSFDDIGTPLSHTTFVVLDLETSGASPTAGSAITEIGAVKVRGGEVIGEFQSLVNPGTAIPPFITVLTGITNAMVAQAPTITQIFPAFLEFLGAENETVIVAHNAPFDLGFLKAAAGVLQYPWPKFKVVDTARLARQVLIKEEVSNCKLSTLSEFFKTATSPTHRALDDARATVDVLHGLLDRVGSMGITNLEELVGFSRRITKAQHEKRHLAAHLPKGPGLYIFRGPKNEVLYVGTSRDVRTRVRTYFTAAESRKRIFEMIALTDHIDAISCATVLESQVRELRLISEKRPPYNRRSKSQERATWATLRNGSSPRFTLVRGSGSLTESRAWIGPFAGRDEANLAIDAIHLCLVDSNDFDPCDVRPVVEALTQRMTDLALDEKYEQAATVRNQLGALVRGLSRGSRIRSLTLIPELVAALRIDASEGSLWEFVCIRYGRLAGTARSSIGIEMRHTLESLIATSEVVAGSDSLLPASTYEEVEKILTYLDSSGIRIVSLDAKWSSPIFGGGAAHHAMAKLRTKDYSTQDMESF